MVQTDLTSPDQPGEIFSLRRSRRTVVLLVLLSLAGSLSSEEVSERDSKQLLVRASPSSPGPPRRLLLPGRGNDQISRLNQGPLTLHNGRLRPVASIDRADRGADSLQLTEGRRRRPAPERPPGPRRAKGGHQGRAATRAARPPGPETATRARERPPGPSHWAEAP